MRLWNKPVSQLSPTHLLFCWDRPLKISPWGDGGDWCSPHRCHPAAPEALAASALSAKLGAWQPSTFADFWPLEKEDRLFFPSLIYPKKLCQRHICICENFLPILAFSALAKGDSLSEYLENVSAKGREAPVKQGKIRQLSISFLPVEIIFYTSETLC